MAGRPDPAGVHAAAPKVSVVRRWNVGVKLGWRLASGYFDRVQRRRTGEQQAPVLQVRCCCCPSCFAANSAAGALAPALLVVSMQVCQVLGCAASHMGTLCTSDRS